MSLPWTQFRKLFFNPETEEWDWTEWQELTDEMDFSKYPYDVEFRKPPKEAE